MIYIVEDDENIRQLEQYALKNAGFETSGFETGAQLFSALAAARPQLLLLDVMLPGEDGISLLRRLKSTP